MKRIIGLVGFGFLMNIASAAVTPAHLAFEKVQSVLEKELRYEILGAIAPHKAPSFIVEQTVSLGRGKYSVDPHGFAEFAGTASAIVITPSMDGAEEVRCDLDARVSVVPFAMQMVPILEEETNVAQLILNEHTVQCHSVH